MKKIVVVMLLLAALIIGGCTNYENDNTSNLESENNEEVVNQVQEVIEKRELLSATITLGTPVSSGTLVFSEGTEGANFVTSNKETIISMLSQEYLITQDPNSVIIFEE